MDSEGIVSYAIYRFAASRVRVYAGDIKTINVRWITLMCLEWMAVQGANSRRTYAHKHSHAPLYAGSMRLL